MRAQPAPPHVRTVSPPARRLRVADGFARIQRETQGRGRKVVTVVMGLPGATPELDALLKDLKQHVGAGGSREGALLVIQGDHRSRLAAHLTALGHRVKLAGG